MKIIVYTKSYGIHLVLVINALQLPHGIYWIKGANVTGKSTLLDRAIIQQQKIGYL